MTLSMRPHTHGPVSTVDAEQEADVEESRSFNPKAKPSAGLQVRVVAGVGICVSLLLLIFLCASLARRSSPAPAVDVPMPPVPYNYDTFEHWFKDRDWESEKLSVTPEWSWFGVEDALTGVKKAWFKNMDMSSVVAIAKHINRFLFMRSIMVSGDETVQATLPMHLLILRLLQPQLSAAAGVRALDIGAGTGWLVQAFALMSNNPESKILGMDIEGVDLAEKILASDEAYSGKFHAARPAVLIGDMLKEDFGLRSAEREKLLPRRTFQAVNIGVAITSEQSAVFARIADLVAERGSVTVPICVQAVVEGRCKADFRLYRRQPGSSELVKESGGFEVKFIVPEHL